MSNTAATLKHKIDSASDLKGVVRTMKAIAASSISQYESSVIALVDYHQTVELGLGASVRANEAIMHIGNASASSAPVNKQAISAIVFGSDQGLVGQFNQDLADFVIKNLHNLGRTARVWTIGERIYDRISDSGFTLVKGFNVPTSVGAIAELVRQIQVESETATLDTTVYVFHNSPKSTSLYQPKSQRLLPLDRQWYKNLSQVAWPTKLLPQILCSNKVTIAALIREYVFISLYRACAESLASENASRLAAMQRAEKNIDELLAYLTQEFDALRQSAIDEELRDVSAGYELLNTGHAQ